MRITLTEREAHALLDIPDNDRKPYRVLNEAGQDAVRKFVNEHAWYPEAQHFDAWFERAEESALHAPEGEKIIMEMRGGLSVTGLNYVLTLKPEWFDWVLSE